MGLIAATLIRKPRVPRECATCGRMTDGPVLRLYGAAHRGDPPYVLWVSPSCNQWQHPKITKALNRRPGGHALTGA